METTRLTDSDLRTLATLAFESADDSALPMSEREMWIDIGERIYAGVATSKDLAMTGELAAADAAYQTDRATAARYVALSATAILAAV